MIDFLDWDTEYFGFRVAKISSKVGPEQLDGIFKELKASEIKLAFWVTDTVQSQFENESKKCILTGSRVTFARTLQSRPSGETLPDLIGEESSDSLLDLAAATGHLSHFHGDPNISKEKADGVYHEWMKNSLNGKMAKAVLVHPSETELQGMVTLQVKENIGSIGLIAVNPKNRKKGIGRKLLTSAEAWFWDNGIRDIEIITQGENEAAINLYESFGYREISRKDFYHLWPEA